MCQNAFSVPGARKPEHIFYDTNCDAQQQAEGSYPWFDGIGMCVDVWHFLNKHQVMHEYCQQNCNPAMYKELLDEGGAGSVTGGGWSLHVCCQTDRKSVV